MSEVSQFEIEGLSAGAPTSLIKIKGDGLVTLTQGVPEYTDNTAAVSAGLSIGTIYRTGDNLKIVHS